MTSCGESNSDHAFSRGEYVERCRGLLQEERCCNGMTLSSQPCEDNSDLVEIAPALTERARPPPPYGGGSMVNWAVSGTTASTGMLPNHQVETSSLLVIDRRNCGSDRQGSNLLSSGGSTALSTWTDASALATEPSES